MISFNEDLINNLQDKVNEEIRGIEKQIRKSLKKNPTIKQPKFVQTYKVLDYTKDLMYGHFCDNYLRTHKLSDESVVFRIIIRIEQVEQQPFHKHKLPGRMQSPTLSNSPVTNSRVYKQHPPSCKRAVLLRISSSVIHHPVLSLNCDLY